MQAMSKDEYVLKMLTRLEYVDSDTVEFFETSFARLAEEGAQTLCPSAVLFRKQRKQTKKTTFNTRKPSALRTTDTITGTFLKQYM